MLALQRSACTWYGVSNLLVQLPRGLLEEIDLPQSHIFPPTEGCKSQGAFHLGKLWSRLREQSRFGQ